MERAIGTFRNTEKYRILRENAKKSTIDGATVARAWCGEFYRLRGKVFIDKEIETKAANEVNGEWDYRRYNDNYIDEYVGRNLIGMEPTSQNGSYEKITELMKKIRISRIMPTTFKIGLGTRQAHSVQIAGTFNDWKPTYQLNYDSYTNCWFVTVHLKKGRYL